MTSAIHFPVGMAMYERSAGSRAGGPPVTFATNPRAEDKQHHRGYGVAYARTWRRSVSAARDCGRGPLSSWHKPPESASGELGKGEEQM